jgi:nucleoid-associated protein YgaU
VPALALVAACAAALVFGITQLRREPPVETRAVAAAPAVAPPASGARDRDTAALATAQVEAATVAAALAAPRSPDGDGSVPTFDIARIEPTGDAVIAGRAAPGAVVELWRNGERHDRAVADPSGQFVMVPPRLPAGDYELTLRSRQPDGKETTSQQSVVVELHPDLKDQPAAANRSVPDQAAGSNQTQQPDTTAAIPLPDGSSPSAVERKVATTVVSRGDSLWRISRVTYGAGLRYAIIYKANRDQIRNPDRIYPGQVFVLPAHAR